MLGEHVDEMVETPRRLEFTRKHRPPPIQENNAEERFGDQFHAVTDLPMQGAMARPNSPISLFDPMSKYQEPGKSELHSEIEKV